MSLGWFINYATDKILFSDAREPLIPSIAGVISEFSFFLLDNLRKSIHI